MSEIIDFLSNYDNFYIGNDTKIIPDETCDITYEDITLFHIEELSYEEKTPRKKNIENVVGALNKFLDVNILYLILGDECGVSFYLGIINDLSDNADRSIDFKEISSRVLDSSINGNFNGSVFREIESNEKIGILNSIKNSSKVGILEGVPGIIGNDEDNEGIDRIINIMQGTKFAVAIIAASLSQNLINQMEGNIYKVYDNLFPLLKNNYQESKNESISKTEGNSKNNSKTIGVSNSTATSESKSVTTTDGSSTGKSTNKSKSKGTSDKQTSESGGTSSGETKSQAKSDVKGKTETAGNSDSSTYGESTQESEMKNTGTGETVSKEVISKRIKDWISYIDDIVFPRIDYGKNKGIYLTSTYFFAENLADLQKLGNSFATLYSGDSGNKVPFKLRDVNPNSLWMKYIKNLQIPRFSVSNMSSNDICARTVLSQVVINGKGFLGNWMSSKELTTLACLPQREVTGLKLREEVEFGLNYDTPIEDNNKISIGSLIHSGKVLKNSEVYLDKDILNKHIFVTGVTGSGKTTTCQKILLESCLPFLVIEPAKTEYRSLLSRDEDVLIFTLGKNTIAPFRMNPFEFFPHENITSRVEMIKASIESAFDMEAAIPQIIETSLYRCYEDYGWNISNNTNEKYSNPFSDGIFAFPTLEDLISNIEIIVKEQGFDERLKNDYIGSTKARLQSLLVGSKGLMLNTKRSIDFEMLLEKKVVLELEEIKSSSEKSLIMGLILINLVEAIKAKYIKNGRYQHITMVEEAHRLLSKYQYGDSLNKKQAVEIFTDMLAEVRKYGESLIIADQIPNKLTSEVLKNTNTKIVHRLFAKDDKDSIGNTMALKEEQKEYLSSLRTGNAIIFTEGCDKPIHVKIQNITDTSSQTVVNDDQIRDNILKFYLACYKRGIFPGIELVSNHITLDTLGKYIKFIQSETVSKKFLEFVHRKIEAAGLLSKLNEALIDYTIEVIANYLTNKFYIEEDDINLQVRNTELTNLLQDIIDKKITKNITNKYHDYLTLRRT